MRTMSPLDASFRHIEDAVTRRRLRQTRVDPAKVAAPKLSAPHIRA